MNPTLSGLYDAKVRKLEEQKELCKKMNDILTGPGGLNEDSKVARKNTLAAIAVSQQPGKFEYHKSSAEVKELEETKVLNKLARAVEKVGRELEQIDTEIHSATPKKTTPEEPSLGSLSSWFDMYGRPEGINAKDMISTFEPAGKIFGGTAHHRSFKSQTSALKKGRITR